jgi:probable H4MPT-linked C1 transfer pathway protein
MTRPSALGLDVGGANLKAVHSSGVALSRPFALWRRPADLPDALRDLLRQLPAADVLAVTMTGELCDCFESKRQGVEAILDAVQAVAAATPVRIWQTDGRFVDAAAARRTPLLTAAANWHALATFAGRFAPSGSALLIDVGSTTTDIVPLRDGKPVPRGRTDPERLLERELVYTGSRRTPLCALLGGEAAAELFATTLDVFLLLGLLPEDATDTDTADGRPATRAAAEARLARMLCADLETSTATQRRKLAERALLRQTMLLHSAVKHVAGKLAQPLQTVLLSGSGERLAELALRDPLDSRGAPLAGKLVSLGRELGPKSSAAACAHALAVLAVERPAI